jgi:hypothetical protein
VEGNGGGARGRWSWDWDGEGKSTHRRERRRYRYPFKREKEEVVGWTLFDLPSAKLENGKGSHSLFHTEPAMNALVRVTLSV